MEKKGLIERISSEQDARKKQVLLTEKSRKMMCQVEKDVREMEEKILSGMTQEEEAQFRNYLDRVIQNLGGEVDCIKQHLVVKDDM